MYGIYTDVRASLSDKIQDQTSGVTRGDLVGLLTAIKIAVHHYEIINPDDLEIQFTKCTMEHEGGNDLMTYRSVLKQYMLRLEAAGEPVRDQKAQRVLLAGLNQDIFENFIADARRNKYTDYASLDTALEEISAQPRMLGKLRSLKPGNLETESTFTTRYGPQHQHKTNATHTSRIDTSRPCWYR